MGKPEEAVLNAIKSIWQVSETPGKSLYCVGYLSENASATFVRYLAPRAEGAQSPMPSTRRPRRSFSARWQHTQSKTVGIGAKSAPLSHRRPAGTTPCRRDNRLAPKAGGHQAITRAEPNRSILEWPVERRSRRCGTLTGDKVPCP